MSFTKLEEGGAMLSEWSWSRIRDQRCRITSSKLLTIEDLHVTEQILVKSVENPNLPFGMVRKLDDLQSQLSSWSIDRFQSYEFELRSRASSQSEAN
ncbi:hypothetical protein TNCV_4016081 [Trichonephila clavipes]|nr:hypothetical protein TNCV_4016081 [Trichonephila clavipes]